MAMRLLVETYDRPSTTKSKRYESYWAYTTAFSSLIKRQFHAADSAEADRDGFVSVQPKKTELQI